MKHELLELTLINSSNSYQTKNKKPDSNESGFLL